MICKKVIRNHQHLLSTLQRTPAQIVRDQLTDHSARHQQRLRVNVRGQHAQEGDALLRARGGTPEAIGHALAPGARRRRHVLRINKKLPCRAKPRPPEALTKPKNVSQTTLSSSERLHTVNDNAAWEI